MKKPELLAPGGSFEKIKVAIDYGADAVYVGTPNLSLRARAKLTFEDMKKTVEYAKSKNVKVYAAINIFAQDEDYEEIKKQALLLEEVGVDGIIASDPGVISYLHEIVPNVNINISTQANTISWHTSNFWYNFGAKRIILGREININNLRELMKNKKEDLEVEIFIHGAICFAYSGRCFLSKFMTGRDANCGDCAQNCRWKYNMYIEEVNSPGKLMPIEEEKRGTTIFSSKDLCLIEELPEIIEMGVDSLKIEGRLKTEYYLGTVVGTYRKAIDEVCSLFEKGLSLEEVKKEYNYKKYLDEIEKVNTRELTKFYFLDENNTDTEDLGGRQYNDKYEFAGVILSKENDDKIGSYILVEIKNKLNIGDNLEVLLFNDINPVKFEIKELYDCETNEEINTINPGVKGQKVKIKLDDETISKIGDSYLIRKKLK